MKNTSKKSMFSKKYRYHFGKKPWNGNSSFSYSRNIFIPIRSHLQRSRRGVKQRKKRRSFIQQQNLLVTVRKWPKSLVPHSYYDIIHYLELDNI